MCQVKLGNITVGFFTTREFPAAQLAMDRMGALLLGCVMSLMAWRTTIGGMNSFHTHSSTQILGLRELTVYAAMLPSLILTVLITLHQGFLGLKTDD